MTSGNKVSVFKFYVTPPTTKVPEISKNFTLISEEETSSESLVFLAEPTLLSCLLQLLKFNFCPHAFICCLMPTLASKTEKIGIVSVTWI